MLNTVLVFDIETIPDISSARKVYHLEESFSEIEVAQAVKTITQNEFFPLHLHQIVTISVLLARGDNIKVWSLGQPHSSEAELIEKFFSGVDQYTPTLVSWNGSSFDLPVLHYRALLHGVSAPQYWEAGEQDSNFKWNNYLNRYHYRHLDVMDVLAAYQTRANAPLNHIATMLGFPGKMGMHGSLVWEEYLKGNIITIRNYCETDVLNTFLVYLRFELMRGKISMTQYELACQQVREFLIKNGAEHFQEFLTNWLC